MNRLPLYVAAGLLFAFVFFGPISEAQANRFGRRFVALMNGRQEVSSVATPAKGVTFFELSRDGTTLRYCIFVFRIDNVFAAHIHLAPRGANGPIVVTLFTSDPPTGVVNGKLIFNSVTAADVGGQAALNALIESMRRGDTYVNVHSTDHPPGEIRGQIRVLRRREMR